MQSLLDWLRYRTGWYTIPQAEIDVQARQLIVEHGADAERMAYGNWQRSQWAKGNTDKIERAERVLKAVRTRARYLG